ncbi:MAG: PH domain-containing protein [Oscillospiraceae bacterium]|nr:PH domain-containing protein [Oscillospiraceae bacterium]
MAKIDFEYIWTDKKRTIFGLPISFTRYILTEKKFITRTGFLSITEDEVELYRISDKSLQLPLGQRLFGCGTVHINCRDTDTPVKIVKSIKEPRKFMTLLEENVDIQRDKYRVRGRDMIGGVDDDCGCDDI